MASALRSIDAPADTPAAAVPAALVLAACLAIPLGWTAWSAVRAGLDPAAWATLPREPGFARALFMSLWTGLAATALSLAASAWLLSRTFPGPAWQALVRMLSPMLAVPHAAFAIGLAFLVAPSGWLLRALSPWATGFEAPPPWATTQDPLGLGLIAALVAKEVPFLLWTAATQLQRADVAQRLERELQLAQTLGYSARTAWWRVLWPQLWPRLWAPLLAVLAYSLTVVDMALVIGPQSPPTLAVLAWQWLLDADPAVNAVGACAAWALAAAVALLAALAWPLPAWLRWRSRWVQGHRGQRGHRRLGRSAGAGTRRPRFMPPAVMPVLLPGLYVAVLAALAVGSVSGVWPFPRLWPESLSLQAWESVARSARTLWVTVALASLASASALVWAVAWLELAPARWDAWLRRIAYLPLLLPSVLWVVGLHRLSLDWGLDARFGGLWLAHALAAVPYVLIALSPAYLGFDARHARIAATLGHGRMSFLLRVKWPLLRAALASALAVGFAVSVAQYLPTVFVGAGRFETVTTEAVTLASGAQRSLTAAYAWLQWLLPAALFALAALLGRPRRFAGTANGPGTAAAHAAQVDAA